MAEASPKSSYSTDPILYLYTSLTAGSSHIVTATSRLETILRANRIPFKGLDIATDEKARMLWGRRAGKDESGRPRKLPGLVQMGLVVGDLVEVEDWNEYGELKQHVKIVREGAIVPAPAKAASPSPSITPKAPAQKENTRPESATAAESKPPTGGQATSISLALRQVGEEAAQKAKEAKKSSVKPLVGTGTAEPESTKAENELPSAATIPPPPPISVSAPHEDDAVLDATLMQSPNSTAWKSGAPSGLMGLVLSKDGVASPHSSQSPSSMLTHRGSQISVRSAAEISQVEEEERIVEEDDDAQNEDAVKAHTEDTVEAYAKEQVAKPGVVKEDSAKEDAVKDS